MWKNYGLAAVNVLISSLPLLATWDPIVAAYYWLFLIALFALCSWNVVGDLIVTLVIFHSKPLPTNAAIYSVIEEYFHSINKTDQEQNGHPVIYYTDSKTPYFIPISTRIFVVSLALQDVLDRKGASLLIQSIPKETYEPQLIISQKVFLLSLISYTIVLRVMEFWAIFLAAAIKAIFAFVAVMCSGAWFGGSLQEIINAASWGSLIGSIGLKINDITNFIQDKLIDLALKFTCSSMDYFVKESHTI